MLGGLKGSVKNSVFGLANFPSITIVILAKESIESRDFAAIEIYRWFCNLEDQAKIGLKNEYSFPFLLGYIPYGF